MIILLHPPPIAVFARSLPQNRASAAVCPICADSPVAHGRGVPAATWSVAATVAGRNGCVVLSRYWTCPLSEQGLLAEWRVRQPDRRRPAAQVPIEVQQKQPDARRPLCAAGLSADLFRPNAVLEPRPLSAADLQAGVQSDALVRVASQRGRGVRDVSLRLVEIARTNRTVIRCVC